MASRALERSLDKMEREIKEVNFSLFSAKEVRTIGIVPLTSSKLDVGDKAKGNLQSLYSTSMGPFQNHTKCATCMLYTPECTGHYGYIDFGKRMNGEQVYIIHDGMLDTILSVLRSVCSVCATPLIKKAELTRLGLLRLTGEKRLKAIAKASIKVVSCPGEDGLMCGHTNPLYTLKDVTKERGNYIRYHGRGKDEKGAVGSMAMMSAQAIHRLLKLVSDSPDAVELLGFSRTTKLENMVLENILVLPPGTRPPRVIGDKVTHNDLTNLYSEIIKVREAIEKATDVNKQEIAINLLYSLLSYLFNNSSGKYRYSNNGRPHRTLKCLIAGKGRLIRGYTQGKRVDFCIRSVAGPNPNLRLNQVGLPQYLAKIVTYPELVTELNLIRLQRYMDQGKVNYITKGSGKRKGKVLSVASMVGELEAVKRLEMGDLVDRWIMGAREEDGIHIPGDVVLVNRQPTLHKMSMMGFEVEIVPELTVQMPVNSAAPFGLDFDGDELNIHVPQTPEAAREIRGRMFMTECIVSAQHNRPVVGLTQDSMTASYLMTRDGVFITRSHTQEIVYAAGLEEKLPSLLERVDRYRGLDQHQEQDGFILRRREKVVESRMADLTSSSSFTTPAQDRRRATLTSQALSIIQERQARSQYARTDGSLTYTQWLQAGFRDAEKLSQDDFDLFVGQVDQDRRDAIAALRDERASLREDLAKDTTSDYEKEGLQAGLLLNAKELKEAELARLTPDQESRQFQLESQYQQWLMRDVKPSPSLLQSVMRELVVTEVYEDYYLTGRELYSILFPADYFYSKRNGADIREPVVRIQEGILVAGTVDKKVVGAVSNSIVHDLYKMYTPEYAEDFITRAKWLTDPWLKYEGHTVSMRDCPSSDPTLAGAISNNIHLAQQAIWKLGPRSSNPLEEMRRQETMREMLCSVKNSSNKLALESIDPANSIKVMVESGSKGSKANFGSIITLVGAQEYQGRPIPPLAGGITLPCYERNTREPAATGFVASSYLKGLTASEMFYHQVAAREGLFGTAIKTAETGYIQRRIVKTLEDAVVYPDGTVRNTAGNVIQYAYGEDGFAGEKLVLAGATSSFVDVNRLLDIIQSRRKAKLPEFYTEYTGRKPNYRMPTFTDADERNGEAEEEEAGEEEGEEEEGKEEEVEEEDASDISEGEMDEIED